MLSRGRSAEVYCWGDGKVLKLFHAGTPSGRVNSEANITDSVYRAGLPVPEVFETIEWNNRHGIVFEKIDGISMLDACIEKPQNAEEYGRQLVFIHGRIHDTSIEELPDLLPLLIQKVRNTECLSVDQKQKVMDLLESQIDEFRLCHMDFHPDQVLITENGPRVIDWETACRGNPLSDAARTALILRIGAIARPADISKRCLDRIRDALLSSYMKQYFGLTDRVSTRTMAVWDLVAAVARLAEAIEGEEQQLTRTIANKIEACGVI